MLIFISFSLTKKKGFNAHFSKRKCLEQKEMCVQISFRF